MSFYLAPVCNANDVLENPQLKDRGFFVNVEHPELDTTITYPGPFIKLSNNPITLRKRPPLIGEHNDEIYRQELGLSPESLTALKGAGVI